MELYGVYKTMGKGNNWGTFIMSNMPHDLAVAKAKAYRTSMGKTNAHITVKKMPTRKVK